MTNCVGTVEAEAIPLRRREVDLHRVGPAEGAGGGGVWRPRAQVIGEGACRGHLGAVAGVGTGSGGGAETRPKMDLDALGIGASKNTFSHFTSRV